MRQVVPHLDGEVRPVQAFQLLEARPRHLLRLQPLRHGYRTWGGHYTRHTWGTRGRAGDNGGRWSNCMAVPAWAAEENEN